MTCEPGDWVAFYKGGAMIISTVRYWRKNEHYPYHWEAFTDDAVVDEQHILERRKPEPSTS